jgi:hypothetical protein
LPPDPRSAPPALKIRRNRRAGDPGRAILRICVMETAAIAESGGVI